MSCNMRLRLKLQTEPGTLLRFNYEYALSSWIYHRLNSADREFATWLHEKGFDLQNSNRSYKLFTFSAIKSTKPFKIVPKQGIQLTHGEAELTLSFLLEEASEHFMTGLFQAQELRINQRGEPALFKVMHVAIESEPAFQSTMAFHASKPVFVAQYVEDRKLPLYLSPADDGYGHQIIENLRSKAQALGWPSEGEAHWQLKGSSIKPKVLSIKENKFKAYQYSFELTAPPTLMRIGYYAGFGSKNSSLGLGFCTLARP